MFAFFDQIADSIAHLIEYIGNAIAGLYYILLYLVNAADFLGDVASRMPEPIKLGSIFVIAVATIYLIFGRN